MSRVEEIKAAIEQLSPEERCELAALLNPIEDDAWDRQMKKDAEPGGKLNRLMEAATKEYKEGKVCPFQNPPSEFEGCARILESVLLSSARDPAIGLQKNYLLWLNDPRHPSLRFKPIGSGQWSARVGDHYRAVGRFVETDTFLWIWIGTHEDYSKL